jgi:hypothetical protein
MAPQEQAVAKLNELIAALAGLRRVIAELRPHDPGYHVLPALDWRAATDAAIASAHAFMRELTPLDPTRN